MHGVESVQTYDGVALATRGDTLVVLWNAPARLHRSRWVYDRADEFVATQEGGVLGLMILLPSADPPDSATRAENALRLRKLAPRVWRLTTVAVGDDFRHMVVRSVLRLMALPLGAGRALVEKTIALGIQRTVEVGSPATPSVAELYECTISLYLALGLDLPPGLAQSIV
jgi:hypothetical protein